MNLSTTASQQLTATTLLTGTYVACELIGNVAANFPVSLLGGRLTVPGGVFIYALTFTLIDLVNEQLGKVRARRVVYTAFFANVLLAAYTIFLAALPGVATAPQGGARVLSGTPRIVVAGLAAYLVSSLLDVHIFAWWRRRGDHKPWARVLVSNTLSTLVDSALFITLAFAGIYPIAPLIIGQYLVKMTMTVASLPLIYLYRIPPRRELRA